MAKGKYARKRFLKEARETPIGEYNLSKRTANILETAGLKTKADVILFNEDDLRKLPGIGEKSMAEIYDIISRRTAYNFINHHKNRIIIPFKIKSGKLLKLEPPLLICVKFSLILCRLLLQ